MPNKSQFDSHEKYLKWYKNYRTLKRDKLLKYNRIYRKNHRTEEVKIKDKVRSKVYQALIRGLIFKKPCEVCGSLKSQAHHEDYSKALDIIWLCRTHHNEKHR